ncbi:MAG: Mov34/MPN/PAD-1 family protein [Planctomycetota bacterium]|jgi:hypothetical protein
MSQDIPALPVVAKDGPDFAWPTNESAFYLVTSSGLFLARNNEFFTSAVPTRFPPDFETQDAFLRVRYPKLPRKLFERVVGFFSRIAELHGAEAAVLLAWNRVKRRIRVIVPDQVTSAACGGGGSGLGVQYFPPTDLSRDEVVLGDIHSHVYLAAFCSQTDIADEVHQPGLHIVVGRLDLEPPEFHVEAVVDGARFRVDSDRVLGGYVRRNNDVPDAWLQKVTVEGRAGSDDVRHR